MATDIGGTFTDLVCLDEATGEITLAKASTTPPRFERGVIEALEKAGVDETSDVWSFVHGTTIVSNALTERTGSVTALITTKGFRDVLEIGRSNRPDMYNLRVRKPAPFVERYLRYEVRERMNYKGEELIPLDESDVEVAAEAARLNGAKAVAICFLHSYANPAHERACATIVRRVYPEAFVTMSHEITREWREYERTSTAVLNAYVQSAASAYVQSLRCELERAGIRERLFIMQSNGGVMSFDRAQETPINMVESGPVAGVIGATVMGKLTGDSNIISLDIGGTTAKTSLIENNEVKLTTDYRLDWRPDFPGYPIKFPVVDIVEIGAGGGSIAWFDEAGGLSVGPRSAGAVPGPACYPDGGDEPTVTDANLIAGRINPDYFLGGEIKVSLERARKAMKRIADPLNVDVEEAALGVIRIANANMVNAIKLVSVRRGYEPRDFGMFAFGGGGAMHACALAAQLKIGRVIVPPAPAHFSAWGMLVTDLRADWVQTRVLRTDEVNAQAMNEIWIELEAAASNYFSEEGLDRETVRFARFVDLRYEGQEHTVTVPIGAGELTERDLPVVDDRFHRLHEQRYTFRLDAPVELVHFHLTAFGVVEKPSLPRLDGKGSDPEGALKAARIVDFDDEGRHRTPIFERSQLGAHAVIEGPAIVEEHATVTVVFPGQRLFVDDWGNLVIETEAAHG